MQSPAPVTFLYLAFNRTGIDQYLSENEEILIFFYKKNMIWISWPPISQKPWKTTKKGRFQAALFACSQNGRIVDLLAFSKLPGDMISQASSDYFKLPKDFKRLGKSYPRQFAKCQ